MSAPGKGASIQTSEHDAATRSRTLDQLFEQGARGEAARIEYEAARRSLNDAMQQYGERIIAAESEMRTARREFIRLMSLLAPGVTRLAYTSSRSPEVEARLRNDLNDAMSDLAERGVDTKVVLSEWLGGASAADTNAWRPASLEFGEAVNLAARIAAERRRKL
jgi:hypothetical protein